MFDFPEAVESLDKVPEEHRALYAQEGDKFTIKAEARSLASAYRGVSGRLGEVEKAKRKASDEAITERKARQAYEDAVAGLGISEANPDTLKSHIDELLSKSKNGKELQEQLAKAKEDYERRIKKATETSEQTVAQMRGTLEKHLIDKEIATSVAAAEGSIDLLAPIIRQKVMVTQDGENFGVAVKDESGNPRLNGQGGNMSISELVKEMRTQEAYAPAFKSQSPSGGGRNPGSGGGGSAGGANLTPTDKIKQGLNNRR